VEGFISFASTPHVGSEVSRVCSQEVEKVLDRYCWYILKAVMSYQELKCRMEQCDNPVVVEMQLVRFKRVLRDIKERLGVEVDDVVSVVEKHYRERSTSSKIEANEAMKRLVMRIVEEIVRRICFEER